MAIQQHPLPQDISSYRFRLIGDMTIKQFASLGISIVIGIIVYSLPLPFFFRYPLSFIFVVLGIGMAFVPVQGRSLDVWILAFIRSIYSPTQYIWKKSEQVPPELVLPTNNHQPVQSVANSTIEINTGLPKTSTITPTQPSSTSIPQPQTTPTTASTPTSIISTPPKQDTPAISTPSTSSSAEISPILTPTSTTTTTIPMTTHPLTSSTHPAPINTSPSTESQLPIPFTPTTANTLVGLTLTPSGKILDGVLVEIQKGGLTYRATKSNKLGQFMFARPLENGNYQIIAEKDDYQFSPYSIDLTGEVIRPLKIQAQS